MTGARIHVLMGGRDDVPADDAWLTPNEASVLAGLHVPKRREDWRLGRWTAKRAVASVLGPQCRWETVGIEAASDGAPEAFVDGRPAPVAVSITHRDGRSASAVAPVDMRVGCDLEKAEPRSDGFVADYFTDAERALVASAEIVERDSLVAVLWSAKESALKALRTGLRADTRSVEVAPEKAPEGASAWQPLTVRDTSTGRRLPGWWKGADGFVLTVVTDRSSPPPLELRPDRAAGSVIQPRP